MHALSRWDDEISFEDADPRRRVSAEVDLGATWREAGCNDAWRLAWIRATGELYLCRADGPDGACSDVAVLAVVEDEHDLDAVLVGWRERRTDPDGLSWLAGRVSQVTAA